AAERTPAQLKVRFWPLIEPWMLVSFVTPCTTLLLSLPAANVPVNPGRMLMVPGELVEIEIVMFVSAVVLPFSLNTPFAGDRPAMVVLPLPPAPQVAKTKWPLLSVVTQLPELAREGTCKPLVLLRALM